MFDLLYLKTEDDSVVEKIEVLLKGEFPSIVMERDYDDIHGDRLSATVDVPEKEWIKCILRKGLTSASFMLQTMLLKPKSQKVISEVIDELKKEKANTTSSTL
jgi:hypothetical protein